MNTCLVVLPHSRISSGTESFKPQEYENAFLQRYPTDAHALAYSFADSSPTPRLRLGHLSDLIEKGFEPVLNWVFVDVDNENHEAWSADEAELYWNKFKKTVDTDVLSSAGFYSTRAGYRLVWRLQTPIPVSKANSYLQQFYSYIRSCGIPMDPYCVQSWNTIFRMPNVNRDGKNLKSYIEIEGLKKSLDWEPPLPLAIKISPSTGTGKKLTRPDMRPLGDEGWSLLSRCGESLSGQLDRLREGQPIASKGARQTTMFKLAATIIGKLELNNPNLVYQAMAPSVVATGGVSLDDLWDRCCYLVNKDIAKRENKEKLKDRVSKGQPPIVYHGNSYYVYDSSNKTYRPPVTSPAVCQAIEQWCALPGIVSRTPANKPRSISEYLADYGRQAVDVVVEMGREKAIFQPNVNRGTLVDGCCVPTKVDPEHNEICAEWLKYFAGSHHDRLLDWLATVKTLDRPTCALYIEGPPGTGKGMFASAVAALWGSGATSYADATGKFNGALTKNPVVLVDEMFQVYDGGEGFSGAFRTLIGESSRQLRRKNLPSSTLRGCPRLMITANNGNALKLTENLGKDDLLAIAERILYIRHEESPRKFLQIIGGRNFTKDWVLDPQGRPGVLARHIQHVIESRKVRTGHRFLVSGILSDWHRDLMGNSGIQGATLAALAHFIDRNQECDGIEISGKYIYVNVPSLRGIWGILMGDQAPREGVLANALKTLAGGQQVRRNFKTQRLRCYKIDLNDVSRRAEALQIGDVERFSNLEKDTYDAKENHA